MAFVSCSQYERGFFTSYRRLAEDRPDLVLHLGDYQYEYKAGPRDHQGLETVTLANYRQRHAQYKADPDLQLYRQIQWGRLASFHMLDTRQFRDDQGCDDGYRDCPAAVDPTRSITGTDQEEWLIDGFHRSRARWDILGQQVFFAQRDNNPGPAKVTSMDAWDGYVASRQRITQGWVDANVRNAVVLTGDVHAHWASELKLDYDDPTSLTVGTELVCTSISTGGNGADSNPADHPFGDQPAPEVLQQPAWLRPYDDHTPDQIQADFRCVPRAAVAYLRPCGEDEGTS